MQSKLCRLKSKIFSSTFQATNCEVRTAQRLFLALPGDSGAHFPTNKNVLKVNNGSSRNR